MSDRRIKVSFYFTDLGVHGNSEMSFEALWDNDEEVAKKF